jgi:predicted acyl esterase
MRGLLFLFAVVVSFGQPPGYEVIASKRVMVPTRDGVRLATDIYRSGRGGLSG